MQSDALLPLTVIVGGKASIAIFNSISDIIKNERK